MLDEVRALLILQDRDRRLMALSKELEKLPQDEARAKTKLSGDQAAVTKAHDGLREIELRVKKIELDAETRRTTIKRLKNQQFETRKNDEFQALGHEIVRYEKELDGLETRELEAMEEIDGARKILAEKEAALAKTRGLINEDLAKLAERQVRLKADRDELVAERKKLADKFEGTTLPLYEKLFRGKNGLAVAPLHEGRCGGCQMRLIASTVLRVQTGREIVQCEDCGRLLYQD